MGSYDLEYDFFLLETNDGLSSGVREQCREQVDPVPMIETLVRTPRILAHDEQLCLWE